MKPCSLEQYSTCHTLPSQRWAGYFPRRKRVPQCHLRSQQSLCPVWGSSCPGLSPHRPSRVSDADSCLPWAGSCWSVQDCLDYCPWASLLAEAGEMGLLCARSAQARGGHCAERCRKAVLQELQPLPPGLRAWGFSRPGRRGRLLSEALTPRNGMMSLLSKERPSSRKALGTVGAHTTQGCWTGGSGLVSSEMKSRKAAGTRSRGHWTLSSVNRGALVR